MALYNLENKLELHTKKMDDSWGKTFRRLYTML